MFPNNGYDLLVIANCILSITAPVPAVTLVNISSSSKRISVRSPATTIGCVDAQCVPYRNCNLKWEPPKLNNIIKYRLQHCIFPTLTDRTTILNTSIFLPQSHNLMLNSSCVTKMHRKDRNINIAITQAAIWDPYIRVLWPIQRKIYHVLMKNTRIYELLSFWLCQTYTPNFSIAWMWLLSQNSNEIDILLCRVSIPYTCPWLQFCIYILTQDNTSFIT